MAGPCGLHQVVVRQERGPRPLRCNRVAARRACARGLGCPHAALLGPSAPTSAPPVPRHACRPSARRPGRSTRACRARSRRVRSGLVDGWRRASNTIVLLAAPDELALTWLGCRKLHLHRPVGPVARDDAAFVAREIAAGSRPRFARCVDLRRRHRRLALANHPVATGRVGSAIHSLHEPP